MLISYLSNKQSTAISQLNLAAGKVDASPQPANWSVYMILSANRNLYTGITNNMNKRWQKHCRAKGAKFFRGNRPIALCYQEPDHTRQTAGRREYAIKQLSRAEKWRLIVAGYGPNKALGLAGPER